MQPQTDGRHPAAIPARDAFIVRPWSGASGGQLRVPGWDWSLAFRRGWMLTVLPPLRCLPVIRAGAWWPASAVVDGALDWGRVTFFAGFSNHNEVRWTLLADTQCRQTASSFWYTHAKASATLTTRAGRTDGLGRIQRRLRLTPAELFGFMGGVAHDHDPFFAMAAKVDDGRRG